MAGTLGERFTDPVDKSDVVSADADNDISVDYRPRAFSVDRTCTVTVILSGDADDSNTTQIPCTHGGPHAYSIRRLVSADPAAAVVKVHE